MRRPHPDRQSSPARFASSERFPPAGLRNRPLKAFAQNQIWCAIVALAGDLLAWMGMLSLAGHEARRWDPKRLRLRLFTIPAVLARTGRRTWLRLADRAPWAALAARAVSALRVRAAPS